MRDIKFRIYDKDRKAMYHLLENKLSFGRFEGDRAVDWEDVFADKHEELEIMQYTGLKDKNGKEIYEGDIAKYGNMTGKIMFLEGWFVLSDFEEQEEWTLAYILDEIEVIGNIYDNKNLLEEG